MSNPYKPPRTPVSDPLVAPVKLERRPWPISLASLFVLAAIINDCVQLRLRHHFDAGIGVIEVGALAFIALFVERGRNWSRWALLCVAGWNLLRGALVLSVLNVPEGVHVAFDYAAVARELAGSLCLVAATVLVFGPGRAWFERRVS